MQAKDQHKRKFTKVRFYLTAILPFKRKYPRDHKQDSAIWDIKNISKVNV